MASAVTIWRGGADFAALTVPVKCWPLHSAILTPSTRFSFPPRNIWRPPLSLSYLVWVGVCNRPRLPRSPTPRPFLAFSAPRPKNPLPRPKKLYGEMEKPGVCAGERGWEVRRGTPERPMRMAGGEQKLCTDSASLNVQSLLIP